MLTKQHNHYTGVPCATLKCAVLSYNTMPQTSQVLRECTIGLLTAGMSTRAVTRECNVNFFTISHLQHRHREFGSTSNRPHNCRSRVTTSHLRDCRRPPGQLKKLWVCTTKESLHKLSETVSRKLICVLVLPWPAYLPDMSPIEQVWDALDRCVRQCVPVPAIIQQLHTAFEEEWDNIPQAIINTLINYM